MTRFRHRSGELVHLAYCTNVHPAEDLPGILDQLRRFAAPVRTALGAQRLGVGLWLAAPVAVALREHPDDVAHLRAGLHELGLEVVTLNGFPYRAFQAPVVKLAVYEPDWTTAERADYTLNLAHVLAALLPDDVSAGSISTLPLGWRTDWDAERDAAARRRLRTVDAGLGEIEARTGKRISLALEPEPGCIVQNTGQAIAALADLQTQRIGICLDACHLAVQFEDPDDAIAALRAAGVPVVKAQASAALRRPGTHSSELEGFAEPRFMHQTRACVNGALLEADDLDQALAGGLPADGEWRVHFHVPVHLGGEQTTQRQLQELLRGLVGGPETLTAHIELETYTWDVLPGEMRSRDDAALVDGLARELQWLGDELEHLGLEAL